MVRVLACVSLVFLAVSSVGQAGPGEEEQALQLLQTKAKALNMADDMEEQEPLTAKVTLAERQETVSVLTFAAPVQEHGEVQMLHAQFMAQMQKRGITGSQLARAPVMTFVGAGGNSTTVSSEADLQHVVYPGQLTLEVDVKGALLSQQAAAVQAAAVQQPQEARTESGASSYRKATAATAQAHVSTDLLVQQLRAQVAELKHSQVTEVAPAQLASAQAQASVSAAPGAGVEANTLVFAINISTHAELANQSLQLRNRFIQQVQQLKISNDRLTGDPRMTFISAGGKRTKVLGQSSLDHVTFPGALIIEVGFTDAKSSVQAKQAAAPQEAAAPQQASAQEQETALMFQVNVSTMDDLSKGTQALHEQFRNEMQRRQITPSQLDGNPLMTFVSSGGVTTKMLSQKDADHLKFPGILNLEVDVKSAAPQASMQSAAMAAAMKHAQAAAEARSNAMTGDGGGGEQSVASIVAAALAP